MDIRREGEDQTNGVGLDTVLEEDGDGCVVSERELCSALSDLTASERCELYNIK